MGITVAQAKSLINMAKQRQVEIAQQFEAVEMLGERLQKLLPNSPINLDELSVNVSKANKKIRVAIDRAEQLIKQDDEVNFWKGDDRAL